MPQPSRRGRAPGAVRSRRGDPLTVCLDADGTYVCTAYSASCYIIQKVNARTSSGNLNPDADSFESKVNTIRPQKRCTKPSGVITGGYVYMNGDIGKIPSGVVYTTSPDSQTSSSSVSVNDFSIINGVVDSQEPPSDVPAPGGSAPEAAHNPDAANISASSTPNVPLEQLKQMLSSQLEYYFSRENLANDTYLLSQMDNDQYVPIWTVANFNQVKKLTKDIKLITEVLRESPNVQVDEEGQKVRPSHKRCIVILREIPDSTPLEEVKGLFTGKGCPKLISCEFAHNNSWYVTFENDEDAQKAYRFLREEVKEFQGKPIMARIKAKPMVTRLPIPPVVSPLGTMKNGYRSPQAPTAATPAFDPTAAFPPAQRQFLYNGNSIQSVSYGGPVQIYTFQQHQPFYSANMLPPWGPSSPAYFEFGSVFSVNGLAPQASFAKGQSSRFLAGSRNNRNKRSDHRSFVLDSSSSRSYLSNKGSIKASDTPLGNISNLASSTVTKNMSHRDVVLQDAENITRLSDSIDGYIQPILVSKDNVPPRRKRKEDEGQVTNSPGPVASHFPRGAQFDLEDDAFPPLPGLETSAASPVPAPFEPAPETTPVITSQSQRENRLSDVVKGTAKMKSSSNSSICISNCNIKDRDTGSPRPRSVSPPMLAPSQPMPPQLPTPPLTPDKTVPPVAATKCCTADKSTKTDDIVANVAASELPPTVADNLQPSTTNAATMTDITSPNPPPSATQQNECSGNQKLSYAQVAQHAKDKQSTDRAEKLAIITVTESEKKEACSIIASQTSPREYVAGAVSVRPGPSATAVGRGTNRAEGLDRERGPRRRDSLLRFNSRHRSPK